MRQNSRSLSTALACALFLTGCEWLGVEDPAKVAAIREAEGKAVGAACRHAARAIEDCYALNAKAQKAAVFAGWKEMNDYMRENNIEAVTPQLADAAAKGAKQTNDTEPPRAAANDKAKNKSASAAEEAASEAHGEEAKQSKTGAASGAKHG